MFGRSLIMKRRQNSEAPREMCQIEGFSEFFWIDVREGMVACSDGEG